MKHYKGITGLKAITILLVIFVHVVVNGKYNLNRFINEKTILEWGSIVQLFFMLSAFGMCCGYYEKFKNKAVDFNTFYGNRYKKILPFFSIIVFVEAIFSGLTKRVLTEAFLDLTLIFGFLPKGNIEVVGVGWTLGVIFAFYILFPFFVFLIWNKKRAWFTLLISFIIRFACGAYFVNDGSTVTVNFFIWATQFILGGIIFLYRESLIRIFSNKRILLLILMPTLLAMLIANNIYLADDNIGSILVLLCCAAVTIYAMSYKSFLLENKAIQLVGKYCLEIYLSHMMIYRILEKLSIGKLIANQTISFVVMYILTVAGTMLFSIIAHKAIDGIGKVVHERIKA